MFALRRKLLGSCSGPAQGSAAMSTTGECQMRRSTRTILAAAAAAMLLGGLAPAAHAAPTPQDEPQLLLVHGHGRPDEGTNCNGTGGTWADALNYFEGAGGLDRDRMTTVAYYEGNAAGGPNEGNCDVTVSEATADTKIQDIAKDLANYVHDTYTSKGRSVNIAAHSMGGLVTRVALLGTAEGWDGFPSSMKVDNVATAGTPHQGVVEERDDDTAQWDQMEPGSDFLKALHGEGRELGDEWTDGTDWTVIGSDADDVVSYDSAIDKGNATDQKFGYVDNGSAIGHSGLRTISGPPHDYNLNYWNSSGQHHTTNGWAPLKTLFKAATEDGDGLP
ncbi:PGAP1-like protein [Prauserella rugosa]|uniref:PGAP1-like protein n=2 Tax=Prauserella rugosa TaxID=43354 RepID=A0A660CBG2_9PSEU|nr:PGAP1-like protein [Prauserella sp. Am3]TWH20898.1 PGAP1-like protein [Prauserella rugosa]